MKAPKIQKKKGYAQGGVVGDTSMLNPQQLLEYNTLPDSLKPIYLSKATGAPLPTSDNTNTGPEKIPSIPSVQIEPGQSITTPNASAGSFLNNQEISGLSKLGTSFKDPAIQGGLANFAGEIGGSLVNSADRKANNGYGTAWGQAGSKALTRAGQGAAIGSVIPGVGTLVGAGIGAVEGGIEGLITGSAEEKANANAKEGQRKMMADQSVVSNNA